MLLVLSANESHMLLGLFQEFLFVAVVSKFEGSFVFLHHGDKLIFLSFKLSFPLFERGLICMFKLVDCHDVVLTDCKMVALQLLGVGKVPLEVSVRLLFEHLDPCVKRVDFATEGVRVHLVLLSVFVHFVSDLLDVTLQVSSGLFALAEHAFVLLEVFLEVDINGQLLVEANE